MKKVLTLVAGAIMSIASITAANAQSNDVALGLRATPDGGGFSAKFFVDRNLAIETQLNAGGLIGLEGTSATVVGLLQYHISLPDPSWRIFFGGGAHFGVWDHDYRYNTEGRFDADGKEGIFGIDGVGGVEYVFKNAPIGLSADFKPAINLASEVDFFPHNMFGFGARYYIGK